jgi:hypothetical protein
MSSHVVWTKTRPTQPGWYWYRQKDTEIPHPVKVYPIGLSLYAWPLEDRPALDPQPLEQSEGEFAPLEPPYVPAYVASGMYY